MLMAPKKKDDVVESFKTFLTNDQIKRIKKVSGDSKEFTKLLIVAESFGNKPLKRFHEKNDITPQSPQF